jgi:hypothetical protein
MQKKKRTQNDSMDHVCRLVKDMSVNRKKEIEHDTVLSKAICDLAEITGESFMNIVDTAIMTDDIDAKRKDALLVLQLMYVRISNELLKDDETYNVMKMCKGPVKKGPIDVSRDNVPIYI